MNQNLHKCISSIFFIFTFWKVFADSIYTFAITKLIRSGSTSPLSYAFRFGVVEALKNFKTVSRFKRTSLDWEATWKDFSLCASWHCLWYNLWGCSIIFLFPPHSAWFPPRALWSPTPQFKSTSSLGFSLLYGPTLTSIHDHWKNHSFD